jgi:hypothetical protein
MSAFAVVANAACAQQLAHLLDFARLDAGYARWRAAQLRHEDPAVFAALPDQLDIVLDAAGIAIPPPFEEIPSRLPVQPPGRRLLPRRRYFHDQP